ncbi:MAG: T9SS type A sorting domain-containing protein, partial [Bacteroidetes bacterium]|nr:T9SS type A sorting domain-containing protein [Bacteroidota bacterium]
TQWGNAVRVLSDSEAVYYTIEQIFSKYSMTTPFASNWIPKKPNVQFSTTSIEKTPSSMPHYIQLNQNYPNPFNPATCIEYVVATAGNVELKIYNVLGELVTTLVDDYQTPGRYRVLFDAKNLSAGVYFYCLRNSTACEVKKMIVLK